METYVPSIDEQRLQVVNLPQAPRVKPGASEFEVKYFQELHAIELMNARMGIDPATIINLNPFPLNVEHPLFFGLTVPACPIDKPYTMLVIRKVRFQSKDNEGVILPVDFKPVILAKEFEDQAHTYGGVLVFRGDAEEIAKDYDGDLTRVPVFKKLYDAAKKKLLVQAKQKKQEADNEWNTPARAGARNITDMHRNYVRILLRERLIVKAPDYLDVTRDEAQIADDCPQCKTEPKKGAHMCGVCGWVFDPVVAWESKAIRDPYHQSFQRLSRKDLERLNISHYVAETFAEMDTRLAQEAAEFKKTGNLPAHLQPQTDQAENA